MVLGAVIMSGLAATSVAFAAPQGMTTSVVPSASVTSVAASSIASVAPSAASGAATPNPSISQDLLSKLDDAATSVSRFRILAAEDPTKLKFDFNPAANPGVTPGKGGQVDLARADNFPVLKDLGIASAVGFMNPCGMNTPHTHPRATEFATLVEGDNVKTGFVLENGLTTQFSTTLRKFQGTVFPMGSIHFQFNDNCAPAAFVAGFNSEDPGASQIAQNFFALDSNIVDATLGNPAQIDGTNIAQYSSKIPANMAQSVKSCLDRCKIPY